MTTREVAAKPRRNRDSGARRLAGRRLMPSPLDLVDLPFMRTAVIELALLAVAGGLLGAWIVLRRLAFFAHAVGSATFPGLVAADAAGVRALPAALVVALAYAAAVQRAGARAAGRAADAVTGIVLAAALALGVILASDVFHSGARVDTLLFGSLLGISGGDVWAAAAAAALAALATLVLGPTWLAVGFDRPGAAALGRRRVAVADALLLALVAATVVASLPAVGALLTASLFIVPSATIRLVAPNVPVLLAGSVALALAEGLVGAYVALWLDAPPGPAVAVLGGAVFAATALATAAVARPTRTVPA
jgi:ABC-type Mn2+/Zn2+ transport system permease subunit